MRLDSLPPDLQARALELWPELAVEATPAGAIGGTRATHASQLVRSRRRRSDRGKRRVFISRAWDGAVPFDAETRRAIAEATARDVRSLWAADARGWRHIGRLALPQLMALTRAAGFDPGDAVLAAICALPRSFIDRERAKGLAVARANRDAAAAFDRKPRVRRDWSATLPGEAVVGDVHPLDLLYRRTDGSTATPKAVAWLCARSRYLIVHPVFLGPGEGIRTEHVAASFAQMIAETGTMPSWLYLDNGGEYNWTDFAADAMALVGRPGLPLVGINDDRARAIVKALPYNAPAKPIEPRFRALENALRDLPGWIGGNRMAKKTANVGRAPEPYHGSHLALWEEIQLRVEYLNNTPMPALDGRTPAQVFAERERHTIDPVDLETAFAKPRTVALRQCEFRINNVHYGHDALDRRHDLERVVAYVPIFGDRERIAVETPDGTFLCHAEPRRFVPARGRDGAREAARRNALWREGIRELRGTVDPVDITERVRVFLALNPAAPLDEPAGVLGLTGEKKRAADDRRRLAKGGPAPAAAEDPEPDYWDLKREASTKARAK